MNDNVRLFTELQNLTRTIYEEQGLNALHLEIISIIHLKKKQQYKISPSDIFNLTNYKYPAEIYKQAKHLVEKGYLEVIKESRKKRDKSFYGLTHKGETVISRITTMI